MNYLLTKIDNFLSKQNLLSGPKIYLQPGEHSPEGSVEQHGPRGGQYYIATGKAPKQQDIPSAQKYDEIMREKAKAQGKYVATGGKSPDGRQLFEGPRGGAYYLLDETQASGYTFAIDHRLKEDYRTEVFKEWGDLLEHTIKQIPDFLTDGLSVTISVDMYDEFKMQGKELSMFGDYNGITDEIRVNPLLTIFDDETAKRFFNEEYDNEFKCHPFSAILAHEIGHRAMIKLYERDQKENTQLMLSLLKEYMKTSEVVSKYAKKNGKERFAESFLYYLQNPRILKGRDPLSYNFIKDNIFKGKVFAEPLLKQFDDESELPNGSAWIEDEDMAHKLIEKISQEQKAKEAEEALESKKRKTEAPFVEWKPDEGLVHKQYKDSIETSVDEFSTGEKDVDFGYGGAMVPLDKAKVYLKPTEHAPEGSQEYQGRRGGRYYEPIGHSIEIGGSSDEEYQKNIKQGGMFFPGESDKDWRDSIVKGFEIVKAIVPLEHFKTINGFYSYLDREVFRKEYNKNSQGQKLDDETVGFYRPQDKSIHLNMFSEKLLIHEIGHGVMRDFFGLEQKAKIHHVYNLCKAKNQGFISIYSKISSHEFFAENYRAYYGSIDDYNSLRNQNPVMFKLIQNIPKSRLFKSYEPESNEIFYDPVLELIDPERAGLKPLKDSEMEEEESFGNFVNDDFDKTRKAIKRIIYEDKNGKQKGT